MEIITLDVPWQVNYARRERGTGNGEQGYFYEVKTKQPCRTDEFSVAFYNQDKESHGIVHSLFLLKR